MTADKDALVKRLREMRTWIGIKGSLTASAHECALDEAIALLTAPAEAPLTQMQVLENALSGDGGHCCPSCGRGYAAPLPQSAPVSREAVIEECAKVADSYSTWVIASSIAAAIRSLAAHPAQSAGKVDIVVGYAQEMASGEKLLLMQTDAPLHEIHDSGKPIYRLYRGALDLRAKPIDAAIAGKDKP